MAEYCSTIGEKTTKSSFRFIPRWLQALFFLAVLGFLLTALASGWEQVVEFEWTLSVPALGAAMLLLLLFMLLHSILWTWMVRRLGIGLTYSTGVRIYLSSQLAKYIPGGIWSFASVGISGAESGLPGSLLLLIYVVSTLMVLGVSGIFALPSFAVVFSGAPGVSVLVGAGLIGGLLTLPFALRWWIKLVVRWRKLGDAIALERLTAIPTVLQLLIAFGFVQLLAFGAFYLYFTSLVRVPVEHGIYAAMAWSGSWFVGLVVLVAPSGLGVREATLTFLLAPIVPAPVAIALSLGYRLLTTALDLLMLCGLLSVMAAASLRARWTRSGVARTT